MVAKAEIPAVFRQQIDAALQSGELHLPQVIAAMPTEPLRLRSTETHRPVFHVLAPLSTAVETDTPAFRWTAVQGAKFQVFVYDERFREIMHSDVVESTEWTVSEPLPRGVIYRWEVRATLGAESASAPAPPDPDAVFQLMSDADAASAAAARKALADNPLGLGIVYANLGAVEQAREVLGKAPDAAAAALLGKLPKPLR